MFKIENSIIHCSRGDSGTITLKIPFVDSNGYMKYIDSEDNIYWYDLNKKKMFNSNYDEIMISLDTLMEQFYQFQPGDNIKFNVYERKGYDKSPLLSKVITLLEPSDIVDIPLTEEDTSFGEIQNKPVTFWYDLTLNDDQTIVCFNEDGAKEFIMYPAKGVEE